MDDNIPIHRGTIQQLIGFLQGIAQTSQNPAESFMAMNYVTILQDHLPENIQAYKELHGLD